VKALYPAAVIGCRVFFWARAMANDHRLDIYVDATTYMALKQRASDVDRSISQHIRFLIKQDMLQRKSAAALNRHCDAAEAYRQQYAAA